jgi:hypothetical protein
MGPGQPHRSPLLRPDARGVMAKQYYPDFSPETEAEIEAEQRIIHDKYWNLLSELNHISNSPEIAKLFPNFPPPVIQPKKLTYTLRSYACELFEVEAKRYPESEFLQLWLNDLGQRIFDFIMERISRMDRLENHASEEVMKTAIMESLRQESNRRLQGWPGIPKMSEKKISPTIPKEKEVGTIAKERQSLLLAYKTKGREKGIRITDEMVAKAANPGKWNDRTMVTWWKRDDKRCSHPQDKKIRAVLARDPTSVWPSK